MLILLPPSEGKTPARSGRPIDLGSLSHPELTPQREEVLKALLALSSQPEAAAVLGVGDSLATELARNTRLRTEPTAPATRVYTGVLFAAAGLDLLTGTARRRANRSVRIISALWGVVSPADRIPAYRLPMGARLPGLPSLAQHWAGPLDEALKDDWGVVVDCRSGAYVPAWRPPSGTAWLSVRVVQEDDGVRTVVSHHAKHTRGVLTHHLLTRPGAPPRTSGQVLRAARELVGSVLREATLVPPRGDAAATLELVLA